MGARLNGRAAQQQQQQQQQAQADPLKSEDDIPACQSCRRKKARCSREQPCSQCVRFDVQCIYDDRRLKPGLRAGVVDSLSRRIETLENMFLGQEILWKQMWETLHPNLKFPGTSAEETRKEGEESARDEIRDRQDELKRSLLQVAATRKIDEEVARPVKRQRVDISVASSPEQGSNGMTAAEIIDSDILGQLVEFYFQNIHHWIPILHVRRFRHQIQSSEGRESAIYILYALIAVCIRFVNDPRIPDEDRKARVAESCRQKVVLCSMESFSVENLQALVIIAFDTIARGRGPSSWSVVGSMARTVEQLQLSVEEDDLYGRNQTGETLIRRMAFLKPSTCWREAEERRRVFWTVFLMDRFCSVSTGWNVSLTSADVKRRLPCEGALWQREDEARAPYFGISDTKGTGPHRSLLVNSQLTTDPSERDCIGGFAYCIEATESLGLVSNFFVHQPLNVQNADEAQLWLMRFKELDLRLVQWKLFLPPKWRDASTLNADGIMDSNLTLAHITHNTAVILLHQAIAYPPHHWKSSPVKLPSSSSAETCIEAANEISMIGQQFLLYSPMLTNPQFSFCLFIAGRMLLTHAKYNGHGNGTSAVPGALDTLIASLFEISGRWSGPRDVDGSEKENLASVFAKRLVSARDNVSPMARGSLSLDIRQTVYSGTEDVAQPSGPHPADAAGRMQGHAAATANGMNMGMGMTTPGPNHCINPSAGSHSSAHPNTDLTTLQHPFDLTPDPSLTLAFPPLPLSFQHNFAPFTDTDADPFNLHLGTPGMRDQESTASASGWGAMGDTSSFYQRVPVAVPVPDGYGAAANGTMNGPTSGSPGSADTLSPGQRISRFGHGGVGEESAGGGLGS
ncbi:fungal-specific transcription factor domain-containing protein [Aspergillus pseudodeflectus]|uniref:Fungal-specific transcription factor domain-containing protein n=1 Tax=Aspergillus pseudodeflectus TaxID=176178 RepID=A0ABR4KDG3_9EURO